MRRTTVLVAAVMLCVSCKDADKTNTDAAKATTTASTTATKVSLAYTTKETPAWEWGGEENIATAMNALKGFETNSLDNTRQYFGDSAEFRGDYWHFKGTADSLVTEMKKYRATYASYAIKMEDYESVKNKSNGDEYVSMWYQETYTDSKGKTDSVYVMDDLKFVNGKIKSIDSKVRHYPASKMK
jgi:hypothetical protein